MSMAENCSVLDPWMHRTESAWINEAFARDNEALTRALQISLSDTSSSASHDTLSSVAATTSTSRTPVLPPRYQVTSPLGDVAALRGRNPLAPTPAGRISKRRLRPSKRAPTTYINADPAHFREMVQRVTGVRLDGDLAEPLVKPEPVRPAVVGARAVLQQTHLPTLDTSAFLLDRDEGSSFGPAADVPASDFDGLLPTLSSLDSWGVM
ncbi:calmodulin-binding protein 25-like [Musa acuminata AAA Group]|uniref:calmodulin-binding protein 25-like n=1 Tax=Musa acuminata AAA Group TaxID=214697 RepID=UPI0031E054CE